MAPRALVATFLLSLLCVAFVTGVHGDDVSAARRFGRWPRPGHGDGSHGDKLLSGRNSFYIDPYTPMFTKAEVKIAATSGQDFTNRLVSEISRYQPLFLTSGTQVHIGFWSGPGNHGALVNTLDSINYFGCDAGKTDIFCAAWDEGVQSSVQIPAFVEMNVEQWYARANAGNSYNITINSGNYRNINPIDLATANLIWGQYSQRYAETSRTYFWRTGKKVKVWCFAKGADPQRIFYLYEYPMLQRLESEGVVEVACAKTQQADWRNASDWTVGTASASCVPPAPKPKTAAASTAPAEIISVATRK